jgi:outer membrane lipoprotein
MPRSSHHHASVAVLIILMIAVLPAMTMSCAPVFPREALDKVDTRITFAELRKNPEQFKGARVLLAGVIIAARNTREGTLIEVLQKPADSRGGPVETDDTEGRFILQSSQFLDAAVYRPGRRLSVIAEVLGRKELPLDEILYVYPLLVIRELHLWEPYSGPRFYFGVGVSGRI